MTPDDLLLDLYCGMGTIGLSMADHCRELIGVEIVPEAIESAKANAARMGDAIAAKSRFFCADAGKAASQLAAEGLHPDVVMLDPPRKGCDEATLSAVVTMSPRRVVYVSCNPPPPPGTPNGWKSMGIGQKRCSRWTFSRGRGTSKR